MAGENLYRTVEQKSSQRYEDFSTADSINLNLKL